MRTKLFRLKTHELRGCGIGIECDTVVGPKRGATVACQNFCCVAVTFQVFSSCLLGHGVYTCLSKHTKQITSFFAFEKNRSIEGEQGRHVASFSCPRS